jgi:hypothetical protein
LISPATLKSGFVTGRMYVIRDIESRAERVRGRANRAGSDRLTGPYATQDITAAGPNPAQPNIGTPMGGTVVAGPGVLFT